MNRKLLVITLIIAFSGLLSAQVIDVTIDMEISPVNHSLQGITDWIDCGDYESNIVLNRKAGVEPLIYIEEIGNFAYGVQWHHGEGGFLRSWTDGYPIKIANDVNGGWFVIGVGNGFNSPFLQE